MDILHFCFTIALCASIVRSSLAYDPPVDSSYDQSAEDGIVKTHNDLRGKVKPAAANMKKLVWDNGLASAAQAWADECNWDHGQPEWIKQVAGPNGSPIGKGHVGQNMFKGTSGAYDYQQVVESWDAEKADYDFDNHKCAEGKMCGHYTQVVWATTTHVGCGKKSCTSGSNSGSDIVVCNYLPAGNYKGVQPYEKSGGGGGSSLAVKILVPTVAGVVIVAAGVGTLLFFVLSE